MACQAWADWVDALKTLRTDGWYYETEKGYRGQHPAAAKMAAARLAYVSASSKLGLSPVDRVRLAMPIEREKTLDEMLG
jgi:P27 family predicted phage terminase small subunit